jgi:hypothetical protein
MSKAEEYRQHAQQCVEAAQRIQNAEERAILLQDSTALDAPCGKRAKRTSTAATAGSA